MYIYGHYILAGYVMMMFMYKLKILKSISVIVLAITFKIIYTMQKKTHSHTQRRV